ncbi:hypothetical protein JRQ81_002796 [Phrynocephalus forsythii]|uniref:E1 ubiquitin-activating enzyme n=1 Tax=Phrynocephalus forsythii TaxID=171643 RepID=A0A9Q1AWV3_9SAUR|nr:hypothetical protein JRQ81_002796 [Phrynocephalus forsythii]
MEKRHLKNNMLLPPPTLPGSRQLFCDFGEDFMVHDPSEAEPVSATILHITQGNPGVLTVAYSDEQGEKHCFADGDWAVFSEVEGMTELNGSQPQRIRVKGENSLEIGDTSSFSPYTCGGVITQVKRPQKHSFGSLRVSRTDPKIKTSEVWKMARYQTLHVAFWALHLFRSEMQRLPKPRDQADADKMVELAQTLPMGPESLQRDLIRTFAYGCTGDLNPINSFLGGLAAQEVLKAASGKFTPLDQWLYFDAFECLPEEEHATQLTADDCAPRDSRYDGQIAIFGAGFQEQLGKQQYFLVGAGAIGCELLKNFAMIGLAAGEGGNITVTDMDTIEYSNLHRQFLFGQQDVSKSKSEVAAAAIKSMNPNINVTAEQTQVGPDTERFYGDAFFLGLDGVANALDSFEARAYVGKRCVQYLKPLLDSGTHGTKGHVQVYVPFLTEPYGRAQEVDEKEYPLCTLRHFPSTIQHTVQWARNQFEHLFKTTAESVNKFLKDPSFLETQEGDALESLELVRTSLQEKPRSWEDCVTWARRLWEHLFSHDIRQLLYNCPPEHTTHMTFILAASRLFNQTHRLHVKEDEAAASRILLDWQHPPFQPCPGMHIPLTDQEIQASRDAAARVRLPELRQELTELKRKLEKQGNLTPAFMEPVHFEKDNACHLDFIVTVANLRAENYRIPLADKLQVQKIAGRIIPAIATTTAAVAGLVCLELYKLVWQHRHLDSYRSTFLNLSEPLLHRFHPQASPAVYKYQQRIWSSWDRIEVPGTDPGGEEITLMALCDYIQREHSLVPRMLLYGAALLYAEFLEEKVRQEHLSCRLSELVRQITGETVSQESRLLVLSIICDEEEEDSNIPPVHVWLHPARSQK